MTYCMDSQFQRLVDNIPGMVYQFRLRPDQSMSFPYVSDFARELYEIEPALIQQDASLIVQLVHPDDRDAFASSIAHSAQTLQRWEWEGRMITPSGKVKWIQGSSKPEKQANDDIVWDGLLLDISDRKQQEAERAQAEAALRVSEAQLRHQAQELEATLGELSQAQSRLVQTEKMSSLGQLVAGVAHEINNPVNFIYGNLSHASEYTQDLLRLIQVYQQHYPDPVPEVQSEAEAIDLDFLIEDLPKLLASMRVGAERIQKIVASLRTFSRMDEAEFKAVDLHDGIDSTLMILQNRLKAKPDQPAIAIIKEYGQIPPVECYAGQLNQVFMNILSNAIDAMEEARLQGDRAGQSDQIRIGTEINRPGWVTIRIADNGTGIPESIRERLFDPFFTTKPVGKGTGMGLSISYQIVSERHGGTLQCQSILGQGTEFVIEIPTQHPQ